MLVCLSGSNPDKPGYSVKPKRIIVNRSYHLALDLDSPALMNQSPSTLDSLFGE